MMRGITRCTVRLASCSRVATGTGTAGGTGRGRRTVSVARGEQRCLAPTARVRSVYIREGYPALLRARRRKAQGWSEALRQAYRRHRWRVEGVHGEAKTQHGLRRAVRRGLSNLRIQAYLTAAVINLKRLVTHGAGLPARLVAALLARHQYRRAARRTRRCAFAC